MNIIALSDVHLTSTNPIARKDNIIKTQFKKLRFIFDYAKKHNCVILQSGDFLDKSRDWNLLVMLMAFFARYKDVRFYCVLGQHDSYFYSRTKGTTLGVLESMNIIRIINNEMPFAIGSYNVFGSGWGESLPIPAGKEYNILVTHISIANSQIYPGQEYTAIEKFIEQNPKYKLIIVGDIHRSFHYKTSDGRHIVNTGPMLRSEANEYNIDHHKPHFWHFQLGGEFDSKNRGKIQGKIINIPHNPSEEVLSRSHIQQKEDCINTDNLIEMLQGKIDSADNKIIFKNLFKNNNIRPKIRNHLRGIYEQAKEQKYAG